MPEYIYKARLANGQILQDAISAQNRHDALQYLLGKNYTIVDFREQSTNVLTQDIFARWTKINEKTMLSFVKKFTFLIHSGIPVYHCVSILSEQMKDNKLKTSLNNILQQLNNGESLSEALQKHPKTFSPMFINMVKVGEQSGNIEQALVGMRDFMEKEIDFKAKLKSAMTYPTFMLFVSIAVIVVMFSFVFPRFIDIFDQIGMKTPAATQIMINVSNFFSENFGKIVFLAAITFFGIKTALARPDVRLQYDRFKSKMPIMGPLIEKLMLVRVTRTLAILLKTGVPLIEALTITRDIAGNKSVYKQMETVIQGIKEGEKLSAALRRTNMFPSFIADSITIGEKGGILPSVLGDLANQFDVEVSERAERISSLVEPIMIIFLGLMMVFIAMAVIVPMFNMAGNIHQGSM
ncbi:MAG: type II secretion system F family protein [Calditrichaeota bacterium]|nr:type II secretion system F family protein [Calditrichota bacterium]